MKTFLRDHWEVLGYVISLLLGAVGLGKLMQRVNAIETAKERCPELVTLKDCIYKQAQCQELQALNHRHNTKEFAEIKTMIAEARAANIETSVKSDEHYENMIKRYDNTMTEILTIVRNNNHGK